MTLTELFALVKSNGRPASISKPRSPDKPSETVDAVTFARLTVERSTSQALARQRSVVRLRTLVIAKKLAPEVETVLTIETENNDTVRRRANRRHRGSGLDLRAYEGSLPRRRRCGMRHVVAFWRNVTTAGIGDRARSGSGPAWTVNDPLDVARLIEMGVDGLITDYPAVRGA